MKLCTQCTQPDTRPGIIFDERGICPPCQYMEKFDEIDWEWRRQKLLEICDWGRKHNVSGYDCIIGVSGGKDSTRQALYVRDQLGLTPLLISCTYPPEQQSVRGAHNFENLVSLGFDIISTSPDPQTWKRLMREGFFKFGNWGKSTEMALFASLPMFAIAYHISLMFLGENPAIQLGDLGAGSMDWNGNGMRNVNTIKDGPMGLLPSDLGVEKIIPYFFPPVEEVDRANLQIVYLGYFWKEFSKISSGSFAMTYGIDVRTDTPADRGAIHPYEALDEDFVFVNQYMKYLKFGFGKVTDEVNEEIRFGRMTRAEGLDLVKRYDGKVNPRYIEAFCEYLEISQKQFWETTDKYFNQNIFEKRGEGNYVMKVKLS